MPDLLDSTLAQLKAWREAHDRTQGLRGRQQALAIRAAFGAEKNDFNRVMEMLYGE